MSSIMFSKKKLLISIVDFNKAERVIQVVLRLIKVVEQKYDLEISIVDNSCSYSNRLILEKLNVIENVFITYSDSNLGYVKATNLSIKDRGCDYLLVINPDVELASDFDIESLIKWYSTIENVGVVGIKQINPDSSLAPVFRRDPSLLSQLLRRLPIKKIPYFSKIVDNYEANDVDWKLIQEVDWLQSSFWFMKANIWDELTGLDERFFLFMSDPDFCFRVRQKGYSCYYNPNFVAYADGVRCSSGGLLSILNNKPLQWHLVDAFKYYIKGK